MERKDALTLGEGTGRGKSNDLRVALFSELRHARYFNLTAVPYM